MAELSKLALKRDKNRQKLEAVNIQKSLKSCSKEAKKGKHKIVGIVLDI
jgi:hypothetical protein